MGRYRVQFFLKMAEMRKKLFYLIVDSSVFRPEICLSRSLVLMKISDSLDMRVRSMEAYINISGVDNVPKSVSELLMLLWCACDMYGSPRREYELAKIKVWSVERKMRLTT